MIVSFSHKVGGLCAYYLYLFSHSVRATSQIRRNSLCMCTLFAPFLHNIGTVNRFVPSWCCQINQSVYVHAICCGLTQRWCYKTNRSCTLFAVSSHNVGTVRRSCLDMHGMFSVLHDCLNCRWSLMSDSGSERRV